MKIKNEVIFYNLIHNLMIMFNADDVMVIHISIMNT
jgi:hypothetical protein